jgi:hypothetical protein
VIVENLVHFIGALLKHAIGVLLLCWRRMLRAGVITFFIGVIVTLLVAVIGTGQAFPGLNAVIVAALFGLALAYGVALTVFIGEFLLGAIDLIRLVEGDAAAAAHITEVVAEREVGQIGQGLRRLVGLPVSQRGPERIAATVSPLSRIASRSAQAASPAAVVAGAAIATTAARGATDAPHDVPAAQFAGEPVPASRLPRISWTYEHEATKLPESDTVVTPSAAATPPPGPQPVSIAPSDEPVAAAVASVAPEPVVEATLAPSAITPAEPEPVATASEPAPVESAEPGEAPSVPEAATSADVEETPTLADSSTHASHFPIHLPESVSALGSMIPAGALEVAAGVAVSHLMDALTHHGVGSGPDAPLEADYADERLAAPATVSTPEGPAEPAERVEEPTDENAPSAPTPPIDEEPTAASMASIPPAEPAPATRPLPMGPAAQARPAQAEPIAEAAHETPDADDAASAEAQPAATSDAPEVDAPDLADTQEIPAARPDGVRRTLPLGSASAEAALDRTTAPRASAPESGLWERLSSALINRSGAPSGPFASAPYSPDEPDAPASEDTPQE